MRVTLSHRSPYISRLTSVATAERNSAARSMSGQIVLSVTDFATAISPAEKIKPFKTRAGFSRRASAIRSIARPVRLMRVVVGRPNDDGDRYRRYLTSVCGKKLLVLRATDVERPVKHSHVSKFSIAYSLASEIDTLLQSTRI